MAVDMSRFAEVLTRYRELGIAEQLDYEKLYLYSIITHSTAIEGSTVTEIENQLLFDEGISPNRPITEVRMSLNLKQAYERGLQAARAHEEITVALLCELSALVMKDTGSEYSTLSGTFSSAAGDLRLINVSAGRGGKSYLAWQKVPSRLQAFCRWLNARRSKIDPEDIDAVYDLSFQAHFRLVTIHPWADGNGRMSRLLMNMIQTEFGMVPGIVKKESRAAYITSLAEARDQDDEEIFLRFMREHFIRNIEEQIADYLSSQDDTLKAENDTLNDTLNLTEKEQVLLDMLRRNGHLTITGMMAESGFSRPTVTRALKCLQEAGLLKRAGSKKSGHWEAARETGI